MHCLVWQMAGSVGMYLLGLQLACGFAFNRSLSLFTGHVLAQCCIYLLGITFYPVSCVLPSCLLSFTQCAFVTHGLHWFSVYMLAALVCVLSTRITLVSPIGTLIARLHWSCSVWLIVCSVDILLVWMALLLTQLPFWLPRVWSTCPVPSLCLVCLDCWVTFVHFTSLVHVAVGSLNLHLARSVYIWLTQVPIHVSDSGSNIWLSWHCSVSAS